MASPLVFRFVALKVIGSATPPPSTLFEEKIVIPYPPDKKLEAYSETIIKLSQFSCLEDLNGDKSNY